MKEATVSVLKDWIGLMLLGIGISFPAHQFFGGLALAVAGASFARHLKPEENARELWVVVLGAVLAAIIVAELVYFAAPTFPIQLAMCAAGFFSRYIARIALKAAGLVEKKTDRIVDRALDRVFPKDADR